MDRLGSGDNMARPLGPLKGLTDEADEFAKWLRKMTSGVTVRILETHFPYGKSSWSAFRDGSKLPPPRLVEQLAERYVREPAMRARYLADGLRLLRVAQEAAKTLENGRDVPVPRPRRNDPVHEAFLRLDDARQWQIEALEKLAVSERQRRELEDTVSFLQERCTALESERDRAREDVRAELQDELQVSLEYQRQADEKLEQARRAEEKAYQLRLAAEKQVTLERMAFRQTQQDVGQGTVPPPGSGPSIVQELNLPPLDQIHAFLEAKQQQLDAQDHDLARLDEQIGLGLTHTADQHEQPIRLVQGHVVDSTRHPEPPHVLETPQDNTGKPLTSEDHTSNPDPNSFSTAGPSRSPADQTRNELVTGLQAVNTPAALSTALSRLRQREGRQPIANLTKTAFPGNLKDDLLLMTVMRWIDGNTLPDTWPHLEALVRAMGATDQEAEAFRQAYTRIVANFPTGPSPDLAELPTTARRLAGLVRRISRSPAPKRRVITAVLTPCTILVLSTGYTAGLQAQPGPGSWKLAGYGALALLGCILALLLAFPRPAPARTRKHAGPGLGLGLLALPIGLTLPWVLDSDVAGHWLAALVGLV
ncbi:hypothetical protein [Streptomyces agglomeratus]|uniref:hypothetical protein n=1 Tax=Streptomyces agglomeratus TaxID=285458 RepID=UPI000854B85B|nr:hypothetical protein [Streptomyces agglomeratus]OEJ36530.1 hypothetical protein BGK72_38180 [Streptomyces agglomeratus]